MIGVATRYKERNVSAVMVLAGYDPIAAEGAVASIALYIVVYLFMNLGAFAIVAFLRNAMQSEEIADYAGLIRRCPGTVICFSLILFSLVGLPPLAGFIGKFAIFASLVEGYRVSSAAGVPAVYLIVLLAVGGVNTLPARARSAVHIDLEVLLINQEIRKGIECG